MEAPTQEAILLFGDSITQGSWINFGLAHQLASRYARKLDVINRGFGGYNTDQALQIFGKVFADSSPGLLGAPKVRLLTVWFGANDASLPGSSHYVQEDRFRSNLVQLVNLIKTPGSTYHSPDTRIVLITPPPVNTHQWPDHDRDFNRAKSYAEIVKQVGNSVGVPVADVWTKIWDEAGHNEEALQQFLEDGLHLNGKGYNFVFELIMKIIQDIYPEIHYDRLPLVINA